MNAIQRVPAFGPLRNQYDAQQALIEAALDRKFKEGRASVDVITHYNAGRSDGKREMRWWAVRYPGVYVALGTCFGVVLTIVAAGVVL